MSNLKLVPDAPTPLEKLLLDASRAEQPSEEHKARLRSALGIGAALPAPLAAGSLPTASSTPGAPARSSVMGKVAAGIGAVVVAGALWFGRERSPSPAVAPVVAVSPPVAVAPPASATVVVAPPAAEAARSPEVAAPPAPQAEAPPPAPRAPAPTRSDDLGEQIRLIELARAGVAARDPRSALRALDSYGSQFPRGSFGQEALVLRIRAVDQAGDFARATALAKSFVARYPTSPHVARLKPIAERRASR